MTALADAPADVKLGYANGPNPFAGTKDVSLYVNDQFVKKLALPSTGQWTDYGTLTDRLLLRAGSNDVSIRFDAGDDGNVNLDYLDVTQNEPIQCAPTFEPDDEFDGELDRCRWSTILNEDPSGYTVADGKLQIEAQDGDIVGSTVSARNVVLQRAPTDGSWSATTKLSIDGTDDYIQAGLVAHASAGDWGKLVVMRQPTGEWVTGARARVRLPEQRDAARRRAERHHAADVRVGGPAARPLLARRRCDLDRGRRGLRADRAVGAGHRARRLQRHRRGGRLVRVLPRRRARPAASAALRRRRTPRRRATRCCSTAPTRSLEDWAYAGGGSFVREDCTIRSVGAFGLLYTTQDHEAPYSLKLEWMMPGDDNSGVFVGFPDTGANTDQTSISQGEEIQIDATDNPAQTTGAIYLEQAADTAARDAVLQPAG